MTTDYMCIENIYDLHSGARVKSIVTTREPRIGLTQKKIFLATNGLLWLHSVESTVSIDDRKCYSYKEYDRNGRKLFDQQINADGTSKELVFDRQTGKPMLSLVGAQRPIRSRFDKQVSTA